MNAINIPDVLKLTNGKKIITSESDLYITKSGIYDFRKDGYIICIFKDSTHNKISAEICYTGISTYSDFDDLDLTKDTYEILNKLNQSNAMYVN